MTGIAIHAEISVPDADGRQQLVLMAVGPVEEQARAAAVLQTLTPLFKPSEPKGALTVPLTWAAVVQISATFGPVFVPGPALCVWIEAQIRVRQPTETPPLQHEPPEGLVPYAWQRTGAAMIAATGGALITDEPGTGKTITTILGLVEWADRNGLGTIDLLGPVVVVCPASVVDPWVEAWRTWAPHARTVAWRGSPKKRASLAGTAQVYVTSYETCRVDAPPASGAHGKKLAPLVQLKPGALVVDECHLIKNASSARSTAVRRLARKVRAKRGPVVALSGTPITHHPGDLWPTLEAVEPEAFPAKERWVKRYCLTLAGAAEGEEQILGLHPRAEAEFRQTLLGQHRRVAKADVLTQLPPKVYSVRTVDIPREWRKVYDDFESQMLAELPAGPDGQVQELSVFDQLTVYGHLRQLASAAADVEVTYGPDVDEQTGEPKRHVHLELKAPSWKVDALLEVLAERPDDQVVAFAPSRQLMMLAGAAAEKAGRRVGYVVGEQSQAQRSEYVRAFQAGELDLICGTTGAGGVGITLTAARTVVFLQRPWEVEKATQAEDRCHRIGSEIHDSIEVIDIVTRDSIEERIWVRLKEKAGQLAELLQDPRIVTELLGGRSVTDLRKAPMSQPAISPPSPPRERASSKGRPGDFHARCNLVRWVPEKKLTPIELEGAAALPRRFVELDSEKVDKTKGRHGRWERGLPACDGFETDDPAAFEAHMDAEHSRPLAWSKGYNEALSRSTRAGWRTPALAAAGKPLPKATAEQLRECPACGLYGQADTEAGRLWWDEHLRGCELAQTGVAS